MLDDNTLTVVEGYASIAVFLLLHGTGLVLAIRARRRYPRAMPFAIAGYACVLLAQIIVPVLAALNAATLSGRDDLAGSEVLSLLTSGVSLVLTIGGLVPIVIALVRGPLARDRRAMANGEVR